MKKDKFKNLPKIEYLWQDRMHHLWFSLSFTKYSLSEDRIFLERGFLNTKSDEILLYRIRDLRVSISLAQRIFRTGTITIISSDQSNSHLEIKNVRFPREVKELIHTNVEKAKNERRMRPLEMMGGDGDFEYANDSESAE